MSKLKSINKLMDTYNPYQSMLEQTRGLVKKWGPTGLLEGLKGESEVHGMSVLLENQARQLIDEASSTGTSANSEEWSGVALPLVRKVFGEIAAKNFVSVQPMNLPSGLVFYLEFKYGTAQPGFTSAASAYGTTNTAADASGGLYGAGRFGYSINESTTDATSISSSATWGSAENSASIAAATWADVDFNSDLSASVGTYLWKVTVPSEEFTRADDEGVRAFSASFSDTVVASYPAYSAVDSNDDYTFIYSGSNTDDGTTTITVSYHQQPTDTTRGDFEDTSAAGTAAVSSSIPEIDIAMNSVPIVAKTRKLKAVWTPEMAQDLNAYHSVDAEAELTSMLSEYVSMEIDLEILDMLLQNALTTEYWSAKPGYEYDSDTTTFTSDSSVASAYAYTKQTWYQTLIQKIQKVSNKIHQKTMRGGANFIVCGPTVATVLESIPGFSVNTDGNQQEYAMGVQKLGTMSNRWSVYKNPYMLEDTILIGFRGSQFLETGAVYAPYIPLIMTPLVYDPNNFTPRKGVMTRYAKKIVRPEFYGKVVVSDTDWI